MVTTVLTRTACLGGDVTRTFMGEEAYRSTLFFNQQTVRVDLFLDILDGKIKPMPFDMLKNWIVHPDRLGVYSQTENMGWWRAAAPKCLIMDNYSEIVDKRFEHWMGYGFCGVYNDIKKEIYEEELAQKGMLPPDQIFPLYDRLFQYIKDKWNIPIIYIHFPTVLDPRDQYKQQGAEIIKVMDALAPKYGIQNIQADIDSIQQVDGDYYHYGPKTIANMAAKIINPLL